MLLLLLLLLLDELIFILLLLDAAADADAWDLKKEEEEWNENNLIRKEEEETRHLFSPAATAPRPKWSRYSTRHTGLTLTVKEPKSIPARRKKAIMSEELARWAGIGSHLVSAFCHGIDTLSDRCRCRWKIARNAMTHSIERDFNCDSSWTTSIYI